MKKVIWKWFFNVKKEELWLNQMADKGYLLTSYSWGKYTFTLNEQQNYTYRIVLLNHSIEHSESKAYLEFLAENNIELVCKSMQMIDLTIKV